MRKRGMFQNGFMLIGVGNVLHRDEGVGISIIRKLQQLELSPSIGTAIYISDLTELENLSIPFKNIILLGPFFGGIAPGQIYCLTLDGLRNLDEKKKIDSSNHFVKEILYISKVSDVFRKKQVYYIGIEPAESDVGEGISPSVLKSSGIVIENILSFFSQHS